MNRTRRDFLKTSLGGLVLSVTPVSAVLSSNARAAAVAPPTDWQAGPGRARYRIDGLTKVTGGKIYARDFHARDIEGWPETDDVVLVMRTPFADRNLDGIDLGRIPETLHPKRIVTFQNLTDDNLGIARTDYPEGRYLVPFGTRPDYLGQAAGLLFYDDYFTMDRARREIRSDTWRGLRFGPELPPEAEVFFQPETSIIHARVAGEEKFSQIAGGRVRPQEQRTERDKEALKWVDKIHDMLKTPERQGWHVVNGTYRTQVVDPMFMEPESGLAWLDRSDGTLHLLIGTQSPSYDAKAALEVFEGPMSTLGVKKVNFIAAYPGGGFGGRDTSMLCLFLALAAAYSERPVRIVNDRFEQFQSGIKRHASRCDITLAVDGAHKFQAIRNHIYLNGGGCRNVSGYVAQVSALSGTGPYAYPLTDIWSRARKTRAVTAGSMRGFGSVQSIFAIETIIDEAADQLGIDPIALRRKNVLAGGEAIDTGAAVAPPGLAEMCDRATAHPLWVNRAARHAHSRESSSAYGVGFAIGMKNYGTGADAALDEVAIDSDGRISITTNVIDMGTGTATTLALATARRLGANANTVNTGIIEPFAALRLEEGFKMQPDNPRWTPLIYESTKAASTSSKWVHGVDQACAVLLAAGLLPAARDLWGASAAAVKPDDTNWVDGTLTAPGQKPIPLSDLAKQAHARGYVVSAMIHAFYSGRWIEADYTLAGETFRWQIDALSVRHGGKTDRELIDRENPKMFTVESIWEGNGQNYGASACLASVRVDRKSGAVRLDDSVLFIGPGKVLQHDLMDGQLDGCFAMGVGQALLEDLPAYEAGAGNGLWNLHDYHVPLSGDVALGRVEKVVLPPESADAPARGIAEVAMVAVAPAITNAVSHATGIRFRELPITPDRVHAAWRG